MSAAPNLLISVPLGLWALCWPLPGHSPAGGRPCTEGWRSAEVEGSPPPPGQIPSSFPSFPLLPPPRFPSSKSFHRPQLQEEADALLRRRWRQRRRLERRAGSGTRRAAGPRAPSPGSAPAPRLSGRAPRSPAAAGVHSRSEAAAPRGWPQPQPCPSLLPSLPPCRPTTEEFTFSCESSRLPLLLRKGEVEGGYAAGKREASPADPPAKCCLDTS